MCSCCLTSLVSFASWVCGDSVSNRLQELKIVVRGQLLFLQRRAHIIQKTAKNKNLTSSKLPRVLRGQVSVDHMVKPGTLETA